MKYQTLNDRFDPVPYFPSIESKVVPDMSFTPREIIQKFSRGEKVPLGFQGLYDSEDDGDRLGVNDPDIWQDDPTRDPAFDFGDYVEEKHALEERQREAKEQAKRAKRASERSKVKDVSDPQRKASGDDVSVSDPRSRETTSVGARNSATGLENE